MNEKLTMIHWSNISRDQATQIRVIFSDLDDTITSKGKLLPDTYQAMWDLYNDGIALVVITGGCAGWGDQIARAWPVSGCIVENGALYKYLDHSVSPPVLRNRHFETTDDQKQAKILFEQIKTDTLIEVPTVKIAEDHPYREHDLAIDYASDVPRQPSNVVQQIVAIFQKYGAQATVSSIHVNGWFGTWNKYTTACIFAEEVLGFSLHCHPEWALYIGDSQNDQIMFQHFPISIGVANLMQYHDVLKYWPRYFTEHESGSGFTEMVKILLEKRH